MRTICAIVLLLPICISSGCPSPIPPVVVPKSDQSQATAASQNQEDKNRHDMEVAVKEAIAVQAVIDRDAEIASQFLPINENGHDTLGDFVPEFVSQLQSIGLTNCPPDFSEAYMRHVHVWEEIEAWAPKDPSLLEAVIIMLTVDVAGEFNEFDRRLVSTWQEVELAALRHGVQAPPKHVSLYGNMRGPR